MNEVIDNDRVLNSYLKKYIMIESVDIKGDTNFEKGTLIGFDKDYISLRCPRFERDEWNTESVLIPTRAVIRIVKYTNRERKADEENFYDWLSEREDEWKKKQKEEDKSIQ